MLPHQSLFNLLISNFPQVLALYQQGQNMKAFISVHNNLSYVTRADGQQC